MQTGWENTSVFIIMEYEHIKNFIESLFADEIYYANEYIKSYCITSSASGEIINREKSILMCPKCGSKNIKCNGHSKNYKQNYKCLICSKSFCNTTNTILQHTHSSYDIWIKYICYELLNLSIQEIADLLKISHSTIYSWRIKLYEALSCFKSSIKLTGKAQIDGYFVATNFKGTRKNMPRISLKRGSNRSKGISHKVCVMTGIDENDNMFLEIVGLGHENTEMMKKIHSKIEDIDLLICDCKGAFVGWAQQNNKKVEYVKSGTYVNANGYNLNDINGLHSELNNFLSIRKGVSTKHLQSYLDMFLFQKHLKYCIESSNKSIYTFNKIIPYSTLVKFKDIFTRAIPVDVSKIYPNNSNQH